MPFPVPVAVGLLSLVFVTAVVNRRLVRRHPSLFFGVAFFAGLLIPSAEPAKPYIVGGAAAISSVLLAMVLAGGPRHVLLRMRVELLLLISFIAMLFLSQLVVPRNSGAYLPLSMLTIGLAGAFGVVGVVRISILLLKARQHRAGTA